jgi:peptidoglycan/xylan/chitin deacetylase (PgdA/CDA1 family)
MQAASSRRCEAAVLYYHQIAKAAPDENDQQRSYRVTPENFARQMRHLRMHRYRPVSYDRLVDCVRRGKPLPDKAVVITFDDSVDGQYRHALPALRRHGFPATFFLTTGVIGRPGHLTWDQVKALHRAGMTIGAHTRFHPHLPALREFARLAAEIAGSKRDIESRLGVPVRYFAYPFGEADARTVHMVRKAGFLAARGTRTGTIHRKRDLYSMRAYCVNDDMAAFRDAIRY